MLGENLVDDDDDDWNFRIEQGAVDGVRARHPRVVVFAVDGDVTTDQTNLLLYYIIKPRVELSLNRFHTTAAVVQSAFN